MANDRFTVRGADIAIVRQSAPTRGAIEGKDAILLVEIDTTLAKDLGEKALGGRCDPARGAYPG